jgi:hypothetical protein
LRDMGPDEDTDEEAGVQHRRVAVDILAAPTKENSTHGYSAQSARSRRHRLLAPRQLN